MTCDAPWNALFITSQDGLRLHARDYGRAGSGALPVVCLPGLARTTADFHELASTLSTRAERPRRVLSVDYRGRGLSDRDPDPANYDVRVESADLQALLTASDIGRAHFIGTSRGGIHIMALAAMRPAAIATAVLNDIGPVIALPGLMRIKDYVGRLAPPRDLEDAAALLKALAGAGFTAFESEDWMRLARRTYEMRDGALVPNYDPALARTLDAIGPEHPVPELWHLFDGLADVPVLAIRGGNSDILTPRTLSLMQERRPDLDSLVIEGQAHAPPLWEEAVIARIARFLDAAEDRAGPA
jgi:pimeloyl-ACP methyl ester carboxylesterase